MSHFTTATKVMIGLLLFSLWSTTTAKARLISKELQLPRENLALLKNQLIAEALEGCEIKFQMYRFGDLVGPASGPCLECRCGAGGVMVCDPRECQPEPRSKTINVDL
ncbi:uncharacterized protein LOC124204956 [Daphnia pulex]|uniref:uncharacterized protein LOC124204956 n=1 Tax=Daphnia pulex TaxID=6669 RepID=UPI001EDCBB84|nr:uncharacterized protein LOC124204956 [Daphnia pulex]